MKDSRKAEGVEEIFMPGEIEQKQYDVSAKDGVEIGEALVSELEELAEKAGPVSYTHLDVYKRQTWR